MAVANPRSPNLWLAFNLGSGVSEEVVEATSLTTANTNPSHAAVRATNSKVMLSNDAKVLVGCIESSSASVTGLFCFKPSEHLFYPQHERCPLAPVAHPVIGLGIPQLTSEACPSSNYRLIQNVALPTRYRSSTLKSAPPLMIPLACEPSCTYFTFRPPASRHRWSPNSKDSPLSEELEVSERSGGPDQFAIHHRTSNEELPTPSRERGSPYRRIGRQDTSSS